MKNIVLFALAMLIAGAAVGQNTLRADPKDPAAAAPPVTYKSAFEGYRPFADQEVGNWRNANEAVGAAGGHKGQLSGSQPEPKAAVPQGPARAPGHGGHK